MSTVSDSIDTGSGQILYLGPPIRLHGDKVFSGGNRYHTATVIRQRVDFGPLANAGTALAGAAFADGFLERFGSLRSFLPRNGIGDEFVERLRSANGVEFPEAMLEAILVVENAVAFAMHDLGTVGYAAIETYQRYHDIVWACTVPRLSRGAAEVALSGLLELLPRSVYPRPAASGGDFDSAWRDLRDRARRRRLSPTTSVLRQAARLRGLPCEAPGRQHLRLGQGRAQHEIYSSMTSATSVTAQKVCADKRLTNRRLVELRLPVPEQIKVETRRQARAAAQKLGFPLVVKPVRGKKGSGVSAGLTQIGEVDAAFDRAHEDGADVLVERHLPGADHRLLVIDGNFVAALTRRPPEITGDGKATVSELIDAVNAHPWRDGFRLFEVKRDAEMRRLLELAGVSLDQVLEQGRSVALRSAANVSTGGSPVDVTDQVHPDNREMAQRAATGVGLDIAGIDFVTTDISRSWRETGGGIVELNARPGLCMHTWPLLGTPRNVAGEVLKVAFPPDCDGRIPIAAVAGDKGTGATARSLDRLLRGAGRSVALVLRKQAYVNGESANLSESQQSRACRVLLRDPQIETLVSTVSPRQASRRGLVLDRCAVAVIHDREKDEESDLFQHGIEILERATSDCFVVGAGNQVALDHLRELGSRRLILVSERINDRALQAHLKAGQTAVSSRWQDGEVRIVLLEGERQLGAFPADTGSGRDSRTRRRRLWLAAMYTVAAAHALGLSGDQIAAALEQAPAIVPDGG